MERENIACAAKGDANAFETLMSAYEKKIYALCLRMMGNPHDGEDSAQEAMLRIWRVFHMGIPGDGFLLHGRDTQAPAPRTAVAGGNGRGERI